MLLHTIFCHSISCLMISLCLRCKSDSSFTAIAMGLSQVMFPSVCSFIVDVSCHCFTLHVSAYMTIFRCVGYFYFHIPEVSQKLLSSSGSGFPSNNKILNRNSKQVWKQCYVSTRNRMQTTKFKSIPLV
jgi:hypothetical protein